MHIYDISDHFSDHRTQIQNTQERRRRRNMTKECVAIKTGMLLKYADEPSWVIVSNDLNELKEIEKMFIQTWRWYRHPIY